MTNLLLRPVGNYITVSRLAFGCHPGHRVLIIGIGKADAGEDADEGYLNDNDAIEPLGGLQPGDTVFGCPMVRNRPTPFDCDFSTDDLDLSSISPEP
jgi:hypothetical protein